MDCINYNSADTTIHHSQQAVSPVTWKILLWRNAIFPFLHALRRWWHICLPVSERTRNRIISDPISIQQVWPTDARRNPFESIKNRSSLLPPTRIIKTTNNHPPNSPPHHSHSSPNPHRKANSPNGNARMKSMIMHQRHKRLFYRMEEYSPSRNISNTLAITFLTPSATISTLNTD